MSARIDIVTRFIRNNYHLLQSVMPGFIHRGTENTDQENDYSVQETEIVNAGKEKGLIITRTKDSYNNTIYIVEDALRKDEKIPQLSVLRSIEQVASFIDAYDPTQTFENNMKVFINK